MLSFTLIAAFWLGCKHSVSTFDDATNVTEINNQLSIRDGSLTLNSTNRNLIDNFFNGTLKDVAGNSISSFSVSLHKGMLWFQSQNDIKNYCAGIAALHSKWDYSDKVSSSLLENGIEEDDAHLGDDVENAVDAVLGFKSMRHQYDSLDNVVDNWKATLPYYLAAPDARSIVSKDGDLRIGNDYYHYLNDKIIAIVHNADESTLQAVKTNGRAVYHPNLEFYDDLYGELITRTPSSPPPPPNACVLIVNADLEKSSEDFRTVTLSRTAFCSCTNPSPIPNNPPITTLTACPGTITTIRWGDGITTTLGALDFSTNHTYSVADPNVGASFTIIVDVNVLGCSSCGAGTVTRTLTTLIKQPEMACFKDKHEENYSKEWTYNNNSYKTETDFFQRGESTLFYDSKLSIETRLYKKNSHGKWKRYVAGVLKTGFAGSFFTNDCTTETQVSKQVEASDDKVYVKLEPNQNFGTQKSGAKEPVGFGTIAIWANTDLQLWKN